MNPSDQVELEREGGRVELRVPLGRSDNQLICWVFFAYRELDPLLTEISIRSPSKAPVLDRLVLRKDLKRLARVGGDVHGLSISALPNSESIVVSFHERQVTVPAVIPAAAVQSFIRATEEIVPADTWAETQALNRASSSLLFGRAAPQSDRTPA